MPDLASSSLVRYRPAVYILAGAAAAASVIYLHSAYQTQISISNNPGLRRSNAVHRQRSRPISEHDDVRIDGQQDLDRVDDAVTDAGVPDDSDPSLEEEGQRMHELMFAISKNRARTEAIVHRGISCDSCNRMPITGIRYRCANCPDFDLCEDCEAQDAHIKTHVFYKIKVPAPWAGKVPQRPWYPGQPWDLPDTLPAWLKQRLIERHPALEGHSARFEGMYQQFACIANSSFAGDPCKLNVAIDRKAFNECFVPQSSSRLRTNLIFDRLFSLFDTNGDNLIDFGEFSMRLSSLLDKQQERMVKDCFRAIDLNDDGHVNRQDCLTFYRAFYDLDRDITLDHFRMVEDGEAAEERVENKAPYDFVHGGRCLSAYFDHYGDDFEMNPRWRMGKMEDAHGDMVPESDPAMILEEPEDEFDRTALETGSWAWSGGRDELYRDLDRMHRNPDIPTNGIRAGRYLNRDPESPDVAMFQLREQIPQPIMAYSNDTGVYLFWKEWPPHATSNATKSVTYVRVDEEEYDSEKTEEELLNLVENTEEGLVRMVAGLRQADAEAKARQRKEPYVASRYQSKLEGGAKEYDLATENPKVSGTGVVDGNSTLGVGSANVDTTSDTRITDRLALGLDFTAADTIRDIVEQSLNEMIDPVFWQDELWHLAFQASAPARQKYAAALEDFRRRIEGLRGQDVHGLDIQKQQDADDVERVVMAFRTQQGKSSFDEVTLGDLRFDSIERVRRHELSPATGAQERMAWPDMTMPQNKPHRIPPRNEPDSEQEKIARFARMIHTLSLLEFAPKGQFEGPFRGLSMERFMERVRAADAKQNGSLSRWMCSWVEQLVLF